MSFNYFMQRVYASRTYDFLASICNLAIFLGFMIFVCKVFAQYIASVLVGNVHL